MCTCQPDRILLHELSTDQQKNKHQKKRSQESFEFINATYYNWNHRHSCLNLQEWNSKLSIAWINAVNNFKSILPGDSRELIKIVSWNYNQMYEIWNDSWLIWLGCVTETLWTIVIIFLFFIKLSFICVCSPVIAPGLPAVLCCEKIWSSLLQLPSAVIPS